MSAILGPSHLTECGLPGLREIPYGLHMCHFYSSRGELAEALLPYFAAGMRSRERCIWVTAEPLDAVSAAEALREAGLDVAAAMRAGGLVIRDHSAWYSEAGKLKGADVVNLWLEEERSALAAGFSGLRITGNTSFLTRDDWALFMEYEHLLQESLKARRIVTLCSYHLGRIGPAEVLDVVRAHGCTLEHPDEGWQFLTPRPL